MTQQERHQQGVDRAELHPRDLIALTTAELVAERGLEGATLRRVAERLEVTTGFISHYYSSKDALLEAALGAAMRELVRTVDVGRPSRTLEEWADRVVDSLPSTEETLRFWRVLVAFQAASLTSAQLASTLRTYAEEGKPSLVALIRAQAPASAPDEAVVELADALWVLADGFGTAAAVNPHTFQPRFVRTALLGTVHEQLAELQEKYP